jgi:hypothetical protein
VAARSKALNVSSSLELWDRGSNPAQGMDVCLCVYSVFVLTCVAALQRADPLSKGSYRLCKKYYKIEEDSGV